MSFYHKIPIKVCQLNKGRNDSRLFYCRNKGLIYAIGKIGEYYGVRCQKSVYKRGIDFLSKNMEIKGGTVSKSELRRLVRPNSKKDHSLKLPDRSVEILHTIIKYIDYPHDSIVHEKCREMNHFCLKRRKVKVYHCYEYMIGDLITQLNRIVGNLSSQSKAYQIIIALTENHKICH